LKNDFVKAYHNKGTTLYEKENFKEAVEIYDKAIRAKTQDPETYYNKSIALQGLE
jgi:superkiller protein 3